MIDDPLSLAVQIIAVLAAGMYPIGFMFGVCSDCCCPGCNYCSSAYVADGAVPYFTSVTLEYNGQEVSQERAEFGNHPISLAEFECDGDNYELRLGIDPISGHIYTIPDACGCLDTQFFLSFRILILKNGTQFFEDTAELWDSVSNGQIITWDFCQQPTTTRTMRWFDTGPLDFYDQYPYDEACHPEELEGATVDLTLEWDYVCECGACCRDSGCEPNVPESWCEDEYWGNTSGTWQGVGTDCDPDPCV